MLPLIRPCLRDKESQCVIYREQITQWQTPIKVQTIAPFVVTEENNFSAELWCKLSDKAGSASPSEPNMLKTVYPLAARPLKETNNN